jgi:hypothetical protein
MPWNISWYASAENIVVFEPVVPWTWDQYVEAALQAQAMIRSKDYTVDTIYNLEHGVNMPTANALPYFRKVYATDPPNSGAIMAVGSNKFIEALVGIITSVMGGKARFGFVATMDEALAQIAAIRDRRSTAA